jgi:hypothetical protein
MMEEMDKTVIINGGWLQTFSLTDLTLITFICLGILTLIFAP